MVTRSSAAELEPQQVNSSRASSLQQRTRAVENTEKSVIGNDLKIIGQGLKIIGRGVLQVDGEIEGDVQGAEVIVGEKGRVTGMVAGRDVIIRGWVSGIVCGNSVALQSSSHVEGDVHHMSLSIEQGASFEGRSRRARDETALNLVAEGGGGGEPPRGLPRSVSI
jgi:cytoskeletal protein CcmA (bactofilin family)